MADATIHAGAEAPYTFRYTITSPDPGAFDLTTVTGGEFRVRRGSGAIATWPAGIIGTPTAASLVLGHTFVAGDVPDPDCVKVQPVLATPAGNFFAQAKTLQVVPLHER